MPFLFKAETLRQNINPVKQTDRMAIALQEDRLLSLSFEEQRRRMSGVHIIDALHPGINDKINRRKIILDQLLLDIQLVEAAVQLLDYLFRFNIRSYRIFKHRCQEHTEKRRRDPVTHHIEQNHGVSAVSERIPGI
ncbi:hypothetical protein D3C86_1836970 [compost metagenome]